MLGSPESRGYPIRQFPAANCRPTVAAMHFDSLRSLPFRESEPPSRGDAHDAAAEKWGSFSNLIAWSTLPSSEPSTKARGRRPDWCGGRAAVLSAHDRRKQKPRRQLDRFVRAETPESRCHARTKKVNNRRLQRVHDGTGAVTGCGTLLISGPGGKGIWVFGSALWMGFSVRR